MSSSSRTGTNDRLRVLEAAVQQASEAIIILEAHPSTENGRPIVYVNEAFTRMSGYEPDEVIGRTLQILKGPDTDQATLDRIRAAYETRTRVREELLNYRKDGSTFWVECDITYVTDDDGNLTHWISIQRDITRRKRAEHAAERITHLQESISDVFFAVDARGRFTYVNQQTTRLLHLQRHTALGQWLWDVVPRDWEPLSEDRYREALLHSRPLSYEAFDGVHDQWFDVHLYPYAGGLSVYMSDATRRQKAERALSESEQRFEATFYQAAVGIAHVAPDGRWLRFNDRLCEITGYTRTKLRSLSFQEITHPDDLGADLSYRQRLLDGTLDTFRLEKRYLRQDGTVTWVTLTGSAVREPSGTPKYLIAVVEDITERKLAEEQLRERERFIYQLANAMPGILYVYDLEEECTVYANQETEVILGYTPEEIRHMGRTFTPTVLHREDTPVVTASRERFLTRPNAGMIEAEYRVRHRQGSWRWLYSRESVFRRRDDGAPRQLLGVAVDITDRKHSEALLRLSESRYRALSRLVSAFGYAFTLTPGGIPVLEWVTETVEHVLGYTPDAFAKVGWLSLVHREDRPAARRLWGIPTEDALEAEFRVRAQDGSYRWLRAFIVPEWSETEQRVVRVQGAALDVTWQKSIEADLIAARDEAEKMSRLKSAFLHNMSHEIRTPLTAIIGFASILAEELSGEHREMIGIIRSGSERLLNTLNSVLDLAQLEGGSVRLRPERLDLSALGQRVLGLFQLQAQRRQLTLELCGADDVWIEQDKTALERVLTNIVSNAVKFTPEGRITVTIREARDHVDLEVADTGIGISPAFLPHLFDEFKQESEGLARDYEGNGLGLTITKRLVELMDGTIAVTSEKGRGSTFTVRLPRSSPA